jgi:hypothetical protein
MIRPRAGLLVEASRLELHDVLSRVWANLIERPSEPLAFRFMLQPAMSASRWRLRRTSRNTTVSMVDRF